MILPRFAFTTVSPMYNAEIITDAYISAPVRQREISNPIRVRALWDTGASKSVITPHIKEQLGIKADGAAKVCHAGGESLVGTYLVDIILPNKIAIPGVRVSECSEQGVHFDIIIGMDIISLGDFSITGQGIKRMVSFCLPSTAIIDYVQLLKQMDALKAPKPPEEDKA